MRAFFVASMSHVSVASGPHRNTYVATTHKLNITAIERNAQETTAVARSRILQQVVHSCVKEECGARERDTLIHDDYCCQKRHEVIRALKKQVHIRVRAVWGIQPWVSTNLRLWLNEDMRRNQEVREDVPFERCVVQLFVWALRKCVAEHRAVKVFELGSRTSFGPCSGKLRKLENVEVYECWEAALMNEASENLQVRPMSLLRLYRV
jgi:hypothetical protein